MSVEKYYGYGPLPVKDSIRIFLIYVKRYIIVTFLQLFIHLFIAVFYLSLLAPLAYQSSKGDEPPSYEKSREYMAYGVAFIVFLFLIIIAFIVLFILKIVYVVKCFNISDHYEYKLTSISSKDNFQLFRLSGDLKKLKIATLIELIVGFFFGVFCLPVYIYIIFKYSSLKGMYGFALGGADDI